MVGLFASIAALRRRRAENEQADIPKGSETISMAAIDARLVRISMQHQQAIANIRNDSGDWSGNEVETIIGKIFKGLDLQPKKHQEKDGEVTVVDAYLGEERMVRFYRYDYSGYQNQFYDTWSALILKNNPQSAKTFQNDFAKSCEGLEKVSDWKPVVDAAYNGFASFGEISRLQEMQQCLADKFGDDIDNACVQHKITWNEFDDWTKLKHRITMADFEPAPIKTPKEVGEWFTVLVAALRVSDPDKETVASAVIHLLDEGLGQDAIIASLKTMDGGPNKPSKLAQVYQTIMPSDPTRGNLQGAPARAQAELSGRPVVSSSVSPM